MNNVLDITDINNEPGIDTSLSSLHSGSLVSHNAEYKIFNPLQLRGNAEQMNLSVQVDSAFFEAGNVTSSATVLMVATKKTVL